MNNMYLKLHLLFCVNLIQVLKYCEIQFDETKKKLQLCQKIVFRLLRSKLFSALCDCVASFITFELLKFQGIKLFFQTLPLPQFLFYPFDFDFVFLVISIKLKSQYII